jgi:hypothetical protein
MPARKSLLFITIVRFRLNGVAAINRQRVEGQKKETVP